MKIVRAVGDTAIFAHAATPSMTIAGQDLRNGGEAALWELRDGGERLFGLGNAFAVDAHGHFCGVGTQGTNYQHAVRWLGGQLQALGDPTANSSCVSLSDDHTACGSSRGVATCWSSDGGQFALPELDGGTGRLGSEVRLVDSHGECYGYAAGPGAFGDYTQAVWWVHCRDATALPTLPGQYNKSSVKAGGPDGLLGGSSETTGSLGARHPTLWGDGGVWELAMPDGGRSGEVLAINTRDLVGGYVSSPERAGGAAVLWINSKPFVLDEMPGVASDWVFNAVESISECGWVVGRGLYKGEPRAFFVQLERKE